VKAATRRFVEVCATVVAVSSAVGAVHDAEGLDVTWLSGLRADAEDACVRERLAQQRVRAAMRLRGKLPIDTIPEPLS
jgi:glutamate dehydrogenase/leucine dehydrogenase